MQLWLVSCVVLLTASASSQSKVRPRITSAITDAKLTTLHFNTHPLAKPQVDVGAAPATLPLQRMLLVLKRSPEQEHALAGLLDQLQDKSSSSFHQWVTPEQFGVQFGPADSDIQAVTVWLQSQGFQVTQVAKGRSVIEFSGTASQVQTAFHTAIHKYVVDGEEHWANSADPQIPAALAPVVSGVATLHNFFKKPALQRTTGPIPFRYDPDATPHTTFSDNTHFLSPGDYATIYNIAPLYQAGIDGAGSSIAVVARTQISQSDVFEFQELFGIFNPVLVVLNGPDPGNLGGNEEVEADLDATWSSSIAKGATVQMVISASTDTTDGVDLSELYIIDNNLADVMTESFGSCEAFYTQADADFVSTLAQQAAAQGISYLVSTGDSGASGCDHAYSATASGPVSVNLLASTPYTTAVGGTMFNEHGQDATYWSPAAGGVGPTARSYIPENAWNESCSTAQCGALNANLAAAGGGVSQFFAKPSWQAGVTGIPNDGKRDLPDISLSAAAHDPYLLCFEFSCLGNQIYGISGTSASTPSFAGIMALINQKMGGRQGQANYVLYRLAATETFSQCNGSKTTALPGTSCIFNDTTVGNIAVPGQTGYGNTGGKYQAGVAYDLATGLGSVNVNNLATKWSTVTFNATTTALALAPATVAHGSPVTVIASVAHTGGTGSPSGTLVLLGASGTTAIDQFNLTAGAVSATTNLLPGGTYPVTAHYSGDGNFGSSDSAAVTVTVTPEPSLTTVSVLTADANNLPVPFHVGPYGSFVYPRVDVAAQSGQGTPSGQVQIFDDGNQWDLLALNSQGNAAEPSGFVNFGLGTHNLTAHYGGDSSFNVSDSPAVSFTITQAPTVTLLNSDQTDVGSGTQVAITAVVGTFSFGNIFPQGTVNFMQGGALLGTVAPYGSRNPVSGANVATATLFTTNLPVGDDSVVATFTGDTYYTASSSAALVIHVLPNYALSVDKPSVTIARGKSASIGLTITGDPGYTGTISFSAASCSGLPRESTCSFNPASVKGIGATQVTITTTAPHTAGLLPAERNLFYAIWLSSGGLFAGVFLLPGLSKRRGHATLAILIFACLGLGTSCGGGSSSGGGGGNTDPGTPFGNYTITITANSGPLTHVATFGLMVH